MTCGYLCGSGNRRGARELTDGLRAALLIRLWVLDLAYRHCLDLFRGQDAELDGPRSLDRPAVRQFPDASESEFLLPRADRRRGGGSESLRRGQRAPRQGRGSGRTEWNEQTRGRAWCSPKPARCAVCWGRVATATGETRLRVRAPRDRAGRGRGRGGGRRTRKALDSVHSLDSLGCGCAGPGERDGPVGGCESRFPGRRVGAGRAGGWTDRDPERPSKEFVARSRPTAEWARRSAVECGSESGSAAKVAPLPVAVAPGARHAMLRQELKQFEAAFRREHARDPTPADIRARPDIGGHLASHSSPSRPRSRSTDSALCPVSQEVQAVPERESCCTHVRVRRAKDGVRRPVHDAHQAETLSLSQARATCRPARGERGRRRRRRRRDSRALRRRQLALETARPRRVTLVVRLSEQEAVPLPVRASSTD